MDSPNDQSVVTSLMYVCCSQFYTLLYVLKKIYRSPILYINTVAYLLWVPGVVRFCFGKGDYGPYRVTKFENWTPWKPFERYRRESFFTCSESCSWIDFLQPTWTIFMVADIKILHEMHSLEKVTVITILENIFDSNAPSRSQRTSKNWEK